MKVEEIVRRLKEGRIVEIPTDTVNGLICDYHNKEAEEEIFRIKKRPREKILPIFVSSIEEVKKLVDKYIARIDELLKNKEKEILEF